MGSSGRCSYAADIQCIVVAGVWVLPDHDGEMSTTLDQRVCKGTQMQELWGLRASIATCLTALGCSYPSATMMFTGGLGDPTRALHHARAHNGCSLPRQCAFENRSTTTQQNAQYSTQLSYWQLAQRLRKRRTPSYDRGLESMPYPAVLGLFSGEVFPANFDIVGAGHTKAEQCEMHDANWTRPCVFGQQHEWAQRLRHTAIQGLVAWAHNLLVGRFKVREAL